MNPLLQWALVVFGSGSVVSGCYALGRIDALHRIRKVRPVWVAVVDHGPFGFEPADIFRSRTQAESYRRNLSRTEQVVVMTVEEWEDLVLDRANSKAHWDRVFDLEEDARNSKIRIDYDNQQALRKLDRYLTEIKEINTRLANTSKVLDSVENKEHDAEHSKNAETKEFPRPSGGTLVRSTRGLAAIGRDMEKSGKSNLLGQQKVEG